MSKTNGQCSGSPVRSSSPSCRACSSTASYPPSSPTVSWPTVRDDLHVVFGSGPAGRAVATELEHQGLPTRIVNRSGRRVLDGVETIGGDVTDPQFAHTAAHGAHTVYFCLNAPNYHRWPQEFPP